MAIIFAIWEILPLVMVLLSKLAGPNEKEEEARWTVTTLI
jgi:Na+-transporting methylmalonyl-CoA/oxaloacetate decarboxylase gamma subunit